MQTERMKQARIRDIRHMELIQATILALHQQGFHKVTLSQIAEQCGATAASVNYYFGSKEKLLEATMRHLMSQLRDAAVDGLSKAHDPKSRLQAIIAANFADRLFTIEQCSVWVQFWSAAPYAEGLSRLQHINRTRLSRNIEHALRHLLVDPETRRAVGSTLMAYFDGIWIAAAQSNRPINAAKVRADAAQVLGLLLRDAGVSD